MKSFFSKWEIKVSQKYMEKYYFKKKRTDEQILKIL